GSTVLGLEGQTGDGKVYPLHVFGRAPPAPSTQKANTLAGRWVPLTAGLQGLVQGAPTWPLTDVGRRGIADVKSQQASQSECSPWPAPLLMALPMMRTIEVSPNTV